MPHDPSQHRVPLLILGGSDPRPGRLPPSGHGQHPIVGYKGVDIRIGGRPMISVLIEQLRGSGAFDPIAIAGPRRVYERAGVTERVIDTDGGFGDNIRAGIETLRREYPGSHIGVTTCDIIPEPRELALLLEDYRTAVPYDFWYPLIRVPEDSGRLGAFGWKPRYRIVPAPGEPPVLVLPGHLAILDPEALRLDFLYRLMQIGYRTRNRPIDVRRGYMIRQLAWRLVAQDLTYLLTLRVPNVAWSVLGAGIAAARKLRAGTITREGLERAVRKIFVRTKHRMRHPDRRIGLPLLKGLSLAEDIDTLEEAEAVGGRQERT